jgi:hypothetical protein
MSQARGPWTYRSRLRREGSALAACGAVGSAFLLVAVDAARENPWSSVVQLAILAAALAVLGPRSVRRWSAQAAPVPAGAAGSGEPTPLWQLPLICAGLALLAGIPTGAWDAALRVTAGCVLVGLTQAVLLDRSPPGRSAASAARSSGSPARGCSRARSSPSCPAALRRLRRRLLAATAGFPHPIRRKALNQTGF